MFHFWPGVYHSVIYWYEKYNSEAQEVRDEENPILKEVLDMDMKLISIIRNCGWPDRYPMAVWKRGCSVFPELYASSNRRHRPEKSNERGRKLPNNF